MEGQQSAPRDVELRRDRRFWAGLALLTIGVFAFHVAPIIRLEPLAGILPSSKLERAKTSFEAAGNLPTPEVSGLAREIADAAPLEAIAFYYLAVTDEEGQRTSRRLEQLNEVLRRDPRHYFARLWRARLFYEADQIDAAVEDVLNVLPLDTGNGRDYIEALVDVARDPRNRDMLLNLLGQKPAWADAFVRRAGEEIDDDGFRLALASQSRQTQDAYVRELIAKGDYDRAFLIWQSTLPEDQLLGFTWPTDPHFSRENEGSAFGWTIGRGSASRDIQGLYVFFNGRGQSVPARQTMLLGPGYRYVLEITASGELRDKGGRFRWDIACLASQHTLASVDVEQLGQADEILRAEFVVPDDCPVQAISLSARAGQYPFPARMQVREVRIRERGVVPRNQAAEAVNEPLQAITLQ